MTQTATSTAVRTTVPPGVPYHRVLAGEKSAALLVPTLTLVAITPPARVPTAQ